MTIAIDLMGGDHAPQNILKGALDAYNERSVDLVFVGDEKTIKAELDKAGSKVDIPLCHAAEYVGMGEEAAYTLKRKPDSSIVKAFKLVEEGKAKAVVSAGNSGATVASAFHTLGNIGAIRRAALISHYPTEVGKGVLLDMGANVDCDEENLCQFAYMGSAYAKVVFGISKPSIGLLSNGEEDVKGTRAVKGAHSILSKDKEINYFGFLEASLLFKGKVDVVVCDGFVGNIVLKSSEALAGAILRKMGQSKDLKGHLANFDHTEYGGALLLGLNGISILCHGNSSPKEVKNAIFSAQKFLDIDFLKKFELEYKKIIGL